MKRILIALLKPLSFLPALLMMYTIFSFSSQTGTESSALSEKVTRGIVVTVNRVTDRGWNSQQVEQRVDRYEYYVRKAAHMTEYCLLAVTIALPLYVYGLRGMSLMLLAGIFCILFAAGDEYHQSMVDSRGPSVRDVGIDSLGALIGILLVRIFSWIALGGHTRKRR
ncbi:MAG: VanZ family protein [Fusicatenibacter sp.]|nr:VanZ family protein [Lachnospiraceae bacterium]MDY2938150.1 VanZ family protein [Fusicatenibacter sp.]